MVLLDVVYNHFGPDGNYLHAYAPQFFTAATHAVGRRPSTSTGDRAPGARLLRAQRAVLARGVPVRRAAPRRRPRDRRRLSAPTSWTSWRARAPRRAGAQPRTCTSCSRTTPTRRATWRATRRRRPLCAAAQWNDDAHHALHVLAHRRNRRLLRATTQASPTRHLGRSLAEGFAYQGEPSTHRGGERARQPERARCRRPRSSTSCRPTTRSATARSASASARSPTAPALRAPRSRACCSRRRSRMLFMGEEFARAHAVPVFLRLRTASSPRGRATAGGASSRNFARFADPRAATAFRDPTTRRRSRARSSTGQLDRARRTRAGSRSTARLLALRRKGIAPRLAGMRPGGHSRSSAEARRGRLERSATACSGSRRTSRRPTSANRLRASRCRATGRLRWTREPCRPERRRDARAADGCRHRSRARRRMRDAPVAGGRAPSGERRDWRERAADPAAIPRATYRLSSIASSRSPTRRALVPYLARARHQPRLLLAATARARRAARTATTSSTTTRSTPSSAAARISTGFVATAARARHGPASSTSCPITWGSWARTTPGGSTCSRTAQASSYAGFFDIDWRAARRDARGQACSCRCWATTTVSLLERGELQLAFERRAALRVFYFEHRFPSIRRATGYWSARSRRSRPPGAAASSRVWRARSALPPRSETAPTSAPPRNRDKTAHKRRLAAAGRASIRRRGRRRSARRDRRQRRVAPELRALHELLEAQAYRLAYWRVASDEINYRRFFDINDLAALRMEDEAVFEATHRLVLELPADGQGRRPAHRPSRRAVRSGRLFRAAAGALRRGVADLPPRPAAAPRPLYLLAEKIIAGHERMPRELGRARHHRLPLRERRERPLRRHAREAAVRPRLPRVHRADARMSTRSPATAKRLIMRTALAGELHVLANRARAHRAGRPAHARFHAELAAAGARRGGRGFPGLSHLRLPTTRGSRRGPAPHRAGRSARARRRSRRRRRDDLRFRALGCCSANRRRRARDARAAGARVRDASSSSSRAPVTAKGVEDTAFYRYHRLAVAERGGRRSGLFGLTVGGVPRREPRPRAALAAHDARHLHPRHQARRGRARAHRRAVGDAGRVAAGAPALEPDEPRIASAGRRRGSAVAQRRVPALPDAGRHLARPDLDEAGARRRIASASRPTC